MRDVPKTSEVPIATAHTRERQLDVISTVLALALLLAVALLVFFLSSSGIEVPGAVPLEDQAVRNLIGGFIILLLVYVADQRRRLRAEVRHAVEKANATRVALDHTVRMLTFSHESASVLAENGIEGGLLTVLTDAAELYAADAAGVFGEDFDTAYTSDEVPANEAERALMLIAITAAGQSEPLLIRSLGVDDGQAIAVPLRVNGELRFVLGMWNRDREFRHDQLDSLGLMGRMVELAIEREELLEEAQSQLEGTLSVLQYLVSDKRPDYSDHAMRISELASEIGRQMGMRPSDRKLLRLAGLIHDVGVMSITQDLPPAHSSLSREERLIVQQHPRIGSEIAKVARFDVSVQQAVEYHHERMDGSGYPRGLRGDDIPLLARILAVCEVYDAMTNRAYGLGESSPDKAVAELRSNAGVLYDRDVVRALLNVLSSKIDEPLNLVTEFDALMVDEDLVRHD